MWSSVRRYRGRSTRDDDISINCSCITDWCFTWCGNQCSKKHEQRTSVSSQATNDSDQSQDTKCCSFGGCCCVQTTQIRSSQQTSQVLTDSQMVQDDTSIPDGVVGVTTVEAERQKAGAAEDIGHWAYLRRFRPRFFNRSRDVTSGVVNRFKKRPSGPSRFSKFTLWLQQLQPRFTLPTTTTQTSASSSSAFTPASTHGEHAHIGTIWSEHDRETSEHSLGVSPCTVFARGRCGYESFNPNCCKFLPEFSYPVSEAEDNISGIQYRELSTDEQTCGHRLPGMDGATMLPQDSINTTFEHKLISMEEASITVIEVASDVGNPKGSTPNTTNDKDVNRLAQQPSKQTQIHAETGQSMRDIVEIEKVNSGGNGANNTDTTSSTRVVLAPIQSNTLTKCNQFYIPEVVLSRASTPLPNIPEECAEESNAVIGRSPRTPALKKETVPNPHVKQIIGIHKESKQLHPSKDLEKGTVKVDIVNYMTKSSPHSTSSSAAGVAAATKKSVRFKEPSASHSTTIKGKAVYIGTFKHTATSKREPTNVDNRRVTVDNSTTRVEVENPIQTKTMTATCPSGKPREGIAAAASPEHPDDASKGVKEYVKEYSQLCKSSVAQEREILQTVIDGVREYYKMPSTSEIEPSPKAGPLNK